MINTHIIKAKKAILHIIERASPLLYVYSFRLLHGYRGWFLFKLVSGRFEICIAPESLISAEYRNNEYNRYDTIVRLLAVENYYSKNDYGMSLYTKMQVQRGAPEGYKERFKHLIKRVEKHGFDWKKAIDVKRDGYLLDGSHRLALALYHDTPAISARVHYLRRGQVPYGLDWFRKNGFTDDQCKQIETRREKLFWEKGLFFSIILWPPVAQYFDRIEAEIPYRIVKTDSFTFSENEFEKRVRAVYEIDDIATWKVDKKINFMSQYDKTMRVIWIDINNPCYRKKYSNNADISKSGEALKAAIRRRYKGKVPNYIYDVVCHTGDNWQHNKDIMTIFNDETPAPPVHNRQSRGT